MGNRQPVVRPTFEQQRASLDFHVTVDEILSRVRSGSIRKVVFMAGAGISVSAGIPDFRTPGTGLYSNLQKYNLPSPESMFDIAYFKRNPAPFFQFSKALFVGNCLPTPAHYFIRLLHEKGILLRCFTQNIDCLERDAGIPSDLLVEAHGSFSIAHCLNCGTEYSLAHFKHEVETTDSCYCANASCKGLVKPDIVFFGEDLPVRYFERIRDLKECDLLIVMGSSLMVSPFCDLIDLVPPQTPRLLLNMKQVALRDKTDQADTGFAFSCFDNYRDVFVEGYIDESIRMLLSRLDADWTTEFHSLSNRRFEAQFNVPITNQQREQLAVSWQSFDYTHLTGSDVVESKLMKMCRVNKKSIRIELTAEFASRCRMREREVCSVYAVSPHVMNMSTFSLGEEFNYANHQLKSLNIQPSTVSTSCPLCALSIPQSSSSFHLVIYDESDVCICFVTHITTPSVDKTDVDVTPLEASSASLSLIAQRTILPVTDLDHVTGQIKGQFTIFSNDNDGKLMAYQFRGNDEASEKGAGDWILMAGNVERPVKLHEFEGKFYDQVIDVEIDSASRGLMQMKLGVNKSDDANVVSQGFVTRHKLLDEYGPQIADYIKLHQGSSL